jgi:hypothetical protein
MTASTFAVMISPGDTCSRPEAFANIFSVMVAANAISLLHLG